MDLIAITPDELEAMEVKDLRKLARANKVKNYLRLAKEDLITLLMEKALELLGGEIEVDEIEVDETEVVDEVVEEVTDEEIQGAIEDRMETGKHNPDFNQDLEVEEKLINESVAPEEKKEEVSEEEETPEVPKKEAPKKATKNKGESTPNSESKSARVREITKELISSGRNFTSGHVMVQLKDRYDMDIHRSFVSGLIKKVKDEVAAENKNK